MNWNDKRVLITGVTGFVGSALAERLIKNGAKIFSLIRLSSEEFLYKYPKDVTVVKGDLRYEDDVREILKVSEPEIIFHLAAFTHVGDSFQHRKECWDINFGGTVKLIEEASKYKIEKFLFAGTSEEYGNQDKFPINEDALLRPESPYACAKVASDLYCQMMWKAYKFPTIVVRPFNTFGRKNDRRFITEKIIYSFLTGEPLLLGDPRPTRDLNHIENAIDGYVAIAESKKTIGEILNLGSGVETSIKELVEIVDKLCNKKIEVKWNSFPPRPNETWRLCCDDSKVKKLIGWKPKISLENGLKLVIDDWRGNLGIN
jgi:nucleoside-diphosphate-sugar epimerase